MEAIILAAGKGTRMKSDKPKVAFNIAGKTMLEWVIYSLKNINIENINIILGYKSEEVKEALKDNKINKKYYIQTEQLGTGHAVRSFFEQTEGVSDSYFILCGDTPLLDPDELKEFERFHFENKNAVSVLSMNVKDPHGYGRILRDGSLVKEIVEEKDADSEVKKIDEVNSGIYLVDGEFLKKSIFDIDSKNAQNEFYLTDMISMAYSKGLKTGAYLGKEENLKGINDIISLNTARKVIQRRINFFHMNNGVDIYDADNTYIDYGVEIENNVQIMPFSVISGKTFIGSGSVIDASVIKDSQIINSNIDHSHVKGAIVRDGVAVGPYSRLREGAVISERCRVGNFVEIKKSTLEKGVKASHLSYIGDATIGEDTNVGAGTITCNYDGKNKHKTVIGKDSFIGSNTCLVAPVELGEKTSTAAGSVITKDVPDNALAFGRARQVIKKNYRS